MSMLTRKQLRKAKKQWGVKSNFKACQIIDENRNEMVDKYNGLIDKYNGLIDNYDNIQWVLRHIKRHIAIGNDIKATEMIECLIEMLK